MKPQFPASAVVTPCSGDGLSAGSQKACASMWVCTSTKPGATARPSASMTRAPLPSRSPTAAIRPSAIPTSACRPGAPVPSMTRPFLMIVSNAVSVMILGFNYKLNWFT